MDKSIELSQLKQMESPIGESLLFKSFRTIATIVLFGLLALVIFMTVNTQIPLFQGIVLAAFIGSLIGGIFIVKQLLAVISHQAKYVAHDKG